MVLLHSRLCHRGTNANVHLHELCHEIEEAKYKIDLAMSSSLFGDYEQTQIL
jgi:hypothetical protein